MDATELSRWTRFAAKGGIGKCTALRDYVAKEPDELMFLKDDEIVVLMQVPNGNGLYLGYCEGVVGHFQGSHVRIHGRLKRPVMTKRSSSTHASPSVSPSPSTFTASGRDTDEDIPEIPRQSVESPMPVSSSTSSVTRVSPSSSQAATVVSRPGSEGSSKHVPLSTRVSFSEQHALIATLLSSSNTWDTEVSVDEKSEKPSLPAKWDDPFIETSPPVEETAPSLAHTIKYPEIPDEDAEENLRAPQRPTTMAQDASLATEESGPNLSRVSAAYSDGEFGIGMTMLQDMADGEDDVQDLLPSFPDAPTSTISPFAQESTPSTATPPIEVARYTSPEPVDPVVEPPLSPTSVYSSQAPMEGTSSRPVSLYPSGSETGTDGEWDGAADIYDQYRYSRFSMASKMSRFSISKSSLRNVADLDAPPVPSDGFSRPSLEGRPSIEGSRSFEGRKSADGGRSIDTSASADSSYKSVISNSAPFVATRTATPDEAAVAPVGPSNSSYTSPNSLEGLTSPKPSRHIPPSLDLSASGDFASLGPQSARDPSFGGDAYHSPLLHTRFSDMSSNSAGVDTSSATLSPTSALTPGAFVASALRQQLESQRPPNPSLPFDTPPTSSQKADESWTGNIVIPDEGDDTIIARAMSPTSMTHESVSEETNETQSTQHISEPSHSHSSHSQHTTTPVLRSGSGSSSTSAMPESHRSDATDAVSEKKRLEALYSGKLTVSNPSPNPSPSPPPYTPSAALTAAPANPYPSVTPGQHNVAASQPVFHRAGQAIPSSYEQFIRENPDMRRPLASNATSSPQAPQAQQPSQVRSPPPQGGPLFLPHPNAPKPNLSENGQPLGMRGQPPLHRQQPQPTADGNSLLNTMHMAAAASFSPGGPPRAITIYGKTVMDLSQARGPVGIIWALQPFPAEPKKQGTSATPKRAATATAAPSSPITAISPVQLPPEKPPSQFESSESDGFIPRANFFPKTGKPRPRSRSFSGFSPSFAEVHMPYQKKGSEAENKPMVIPTVRALTKEMKQTASAPSSPRPSPPKEAQSFSALQSMPQGRSAHAPSPLSLPLQHNSRPAPRSPGGRSVTSPLPRSPLAMQTSFPRKDDEIATSDQNQTASIAAQKKTGLRQVASSINLRSTPSHSPSPISTPALPQQPFRRTSAGTPEASNATQARLSPPAIQTPVPSAESSPDPNAVERPARTVSAALRPHQRNVSQMSQVSLQKRMSADTDDSQRPDSRSMMTSPPPVMVSSSSASSSPLMRHASHTSLRSKISLSALRIRKEPQPETPQSSAPPTPLFEHGFQGETVQVKDTGFELVTPSVRPFNPDRNSDESSALREDGAMARNRRTSESPLTAPSIRQASRAPSSMSNLPKESHQSSSNLEAHRARELKWIQAMSSTPSSQSRKSKRIRKLLLEGVPASVRYLVWAHLTDSKTKRMPGVYTKLGQRGRVSATEEIERDAKVCFPDQPHLHDAQGPLASLLQAYLTMVPDVEYRAGLSIMAGRLLLNAPEEDAFWTFVSIMDSNLRGYFSSKTNQMEVDVVVLGKILDSLDPPLAKKLHDMHITILDICKPWFSSLFADALPPDFVDRVWDLYLYDGPPFMFRVALAILITMHTPLMQPTSERSVLIELLRRPPPSLLPEDPDTLIATALSLKIKDDDIRKQRVKMDAQMKRQTQQGAAQGSITRPKANTISLPRS